MTKEQKLQEIDILSSILSSIFSFRKKNVYLADISNMNGCQTYVLRRSCYISQVKVMMVKNSLLCIAMKKYKEKLWTFLPIIKGNTFIMISSVVNTPAKIIKDYKNKNNYTVPLLKAAYVSETFYIGNDKLDYLVSLKTKKELIISIISSLQTSLSNVFVILQTPIYKVIEYL